MFLKYRDEIREAINDLKSIKTIYKQIPNMLTLSRIVGIIPINILYFLDSKIAALVVCTFVFLTDAIDGTIARKYNISSALGAKLDAISDKLMVLGLSIPLVLNNPLILLTLFMELGISITNILNEKKGYSPKSVISGKVKTWLLSVTLGVGYLSTLVNISNVIFPLLVSATGVMQGVALSEYISLYKNNGNNLVDEGISEGKKDNLVEFSYQDEMELVEDKSMDTDKNEVREAIDYLKRERDKILASQVEKIPLGKTYMKKMGNKNFRIRNM